MKSFNFTAQIEWDRKIKPADLRNANFSSLIEIRNTEKLQTKVCITLN